MGRKRRTLLSCWKLFGKLKSELVHFSTWWMDHFSSLIPGGTKKMTRKWRINQMAGDVTLTQRGSFGVKEVAQLPRHSSARFTLRFVISSFYSLTCFYFFYFLSPSSPASPPACAARRSSVWCLSSGAPWKPSASRQKCASALAQGRAVFTTPPKKWGPEHLDFFFFFQQLVADGGTTHKTGSVWQKPLLFIDWGGGRDKSDGDRIFIKWELLSPSLLYWAVGYHS